MRGSQVFRAAAAVAVLALPVGACGGPDGTVVVVLDAPPNSLSPLDDRLDNLTLVVQGPGMATQIQTVGVSDRSQPLALGSIPLGDDRLLSLIATTAGGRLIGYGRAAAPVDVRLGSEAEVVLRMRRPYAYVAGGSLLHAFDGTYDLEGPYASKIATPSPRVVATSPDGSEIAVVTAGALTLVSTATHEATGVTMALPAGVADLAYSPDGAALAAAHASGITIIDVLALRSGSDTAVEVPLGPVERVVVGGGRVWGLATPWEGAGCGTAAASRLTAVDLATAQPLAQVLADRPIGDIAIEPASGTLLAALPCEGVGAVGVVTIGADSATITQTFEVPRAHAVAVAAGRIYAIGFVGVNVGEDTDEFDSDRSVFYPVLASVNIDGSSAARVDLPIPEELALSTEFETNGQVAEARIQADAIRALDLAVFPDGSRVAVLYAGYYHCTRTGDPGIFVQFESVIPAIDLDTVEFQLVDASTGIALQRVRTDCRLDWTHQSYLDIFECSQTAGQDLTDEQFPAKRLAVLYGEK